LVDHFFEQKLPKSGQTNFAKKDFPNATHSAKFRTNKDFAKPQAKAKSKGLL
jgi:hypothetical protein